MAATKRLILLSASLSWLTGGCLNQASVDAQAPACKPAVSLTADEEDAGATNADGGDRQVTFYKDLLPILTANSGERTYKCTTCHAHMNAPEGLNSVSKIEDTIESMKKGRMPRSNSRVTPAEIKLFDLWRLQGFQPGDPSDYQPIETAPASTTNCAG